MTNALDWLTFHAAYWLMHRPLLLLSLIINKLSIALLKLAFLPVRPWMKVVSANVNNGGSNE